MSNSEAKFFIIDDDESVRSSLGRLLRSSGHQCQTFCSAEEFLAVLPQDSAGWAVVDVHMPGMNGVELMKVLLDTRPKMRIVLITAFDDPDVAAEAMRLGVMTLRKPFDDLALLAAVNNLSA